MSPEPNGAAEEVQAAAGARRLRVQQAEWPRWVGTASRLRFVESTTAERNFSVQNCQVTK
jgi:hypothetical protein